jgi:hypothetical protein
MRRSPAAVAAAVCVLEASTVVVCVPEEVSTEVACGLLMSGVADTGLPDVDTPAAAATDIVR